MVTANSQLYTLAQLASNMFYRIQNLRKIVFDATNNAHYTLVKTVISIKRHATSLMDDNKIELLDSDNNNNNMGAYIALLK